MRRNRTPSCFALLAGIGLLAMGGVADAQILVVLHDDESDSNTWTLEKQLANLAPESGELLLLRRGSEGMQQVLDAADVVLSFQRLAVEDSTGNSRRLPSVSVSDPDGTVALLEQVFGEEIAEHVSTPVEGNGWSAERKVISLVYHDSDVPVSRTNRWSRDLVTATMLDLGLIDELPETFTFLPSDRRTGYALYDAEGVGGAGPERVERIVNGMGDDAFVMRVCGEDIRDGLLESDAFHSALFPGGSGRGIANGLEEPGREQVTDFIARGGGYVGICAGAYFATCRIDDYLGLVGAYHGQPWRKGGGMTEVELSEEGRAILGEEFVSFQTRYNNGPILEHEDGLVPEGDFPAMEVWAWFRSAVTNPDGELSGEMIDTPAIVASTHGEGRILIISPHPETHEELDPMMHRAFRWTVGR